jgi:hypothetical protein
MRHKENATILSSLGELILARVKLEQQKCSLQPLSSIVGDGNHLYSIVCIILT